MSTIITIDPDGTIEIEQGEVSALPQNGAEGLTDAAEDYLETCPIETSDVAANLAARDNAIAVANYGPLDPGQDNAAYWEGVADRWDVAPAEAKTALCGNCAAFNVTTSIKQCIADGIGGTDAWDVVQAGDLGYCMAFNFKCAAARRCDAWIAGGPLTDELQQSMLPQPGDEEDLGQDEVEIKIVTLYAAITRLIFLVLVIIAGHRQH